MRQLTSIGVTTPARRLRDHPRDRAHQDIQKDGRPVRLDSVFYRFAYRFGNPKWDSDEPRAELHDIAKSHAPGRALDIGCGTGTNAVYLASKGWDVLGIDFVAAAVKTAEARARSAGSSATFLVADATELRQAGVQGRFDLILDIGCYHGAPAGRRDAYAAEVAAVAQQGGDFYLAGISDPPASWRLLRATGVSAEELRNRFGSYFELVDERAAPGAGRMSHFVLYHLVRK